MHLLNVKRFTVPSVSAINFGQTRRPYKDPIDEKTDEIFKQSTRLNLRKPMVKNFELDQNFHVQNNQTIQIIDTYDLDKELFDFNHDTQDIDQPALFTEYIRK